LLERSTDGRNYEAIANIKGSGNFSGGGYTYQDAPNLSNPKYYYRLKMVDNDEKFTYSRVLVENFTGKKSIAIYPTVVTGNQVTVVYNKVSGKAEMKILASDGKMVKRMNLNEGSGYEMVDLSGVASGMYVLVLQDADGIQTSKFIKQ
jgi:trimeric autotransporter adhesin